MKRAKRIEGRLRTAGVAASALAIAGAVAMVGCGRSGNRGGAAGTAAVSDLFDGRTLDGWERREGGEVWAVQAAEIVAHPQGEAGPALLATERACGDFALMLEFKSDAEIDASVIVRGRAAEAGAKAPAAGYEVDLSASKGTAGGLRVPGSTGWLDDLRSNPPARRAFKPGEWNTVRIVAVGDTIRTEVNGVAAANFLEAHPGKGWIGLSAAGSGEVRWRNLKLKSLE